MNVDTCMNHVWLYNENWFHLSVPLIDGESGRDQKVSSLEKIDCINIIIIIIIILFLLLLS